MTDDELVLTWEYSLDQGGTSKGQLFYEGEDALPFSQLPFPKMLEHLREHLLRRGGSKVLVVRPGNRKSHKFFLEDAS